jgi:hypothetical protein
VLPRFVQFNGMETVHAHQRDLLFIFLNLVLRGPLVLEVSNSKRRWTSSWDDGFCIFCVCLCAGAAMQPKHGLFLSGVARSSRTVEKEKKTLGPICAGPTCSLRRHSGIFAQIIAFPLGALLTPARPCKRDHPTHSLACSPTRPLLLAHGSHRCRRRPPRRPARVVRRERPAAAGLRPRARRRQEGHPLRRPRRLHPDLQVPTPFPLPRLFLPLSRRSPSLLAPVFWGRTVSVGLEGGYMGSLGISSSPDSE